MAQLKNIEIEHLNEKILVLENERANVDEHVQQGAILTTTDNHRYVEMREKWQDEKKQREEESNKYKRDITSANEQIQQLKQ